MKSMTGYGKGTARDNCLEINIEVKSVNNRFLDINQRLGKGFLFLEEPLRSLTSSIIKRGTVDIFFNYCFFDLPARKLTADLPTIKEYSNLATLISEQTELINNFSFSDLIRLDLIKSESHTLDADLITSLALSALNEALSNLDHMRQIEGQNLKADLTNQLTNFENYLSSIEQRSPIVNEEYRIKLEERMREILGESIDEMRLLTEAALFADRGDINEETNRLHSHIEQFKSAINDNQPQGRRLEFILQEMGRETNTIGSKSNDIELSRAVIEMKDLLEKLREQVRNAE